MVPAADVGNADDRYGRTPEWFLASKDRDVHVARVGVIAERAVDLLHLLADQLDPVVDLVIESLRDGVKWSGELLALPDVREAVGRLRLLLAMYGGVEITIVTADDQLTLTPELELAIYSRTDRWLFLLDGLGIVERASAPRAVWRLDRGALAPIGPLTEALEDAADRLCLEASPLLPVRAL